MRRWRTRRRMRMRTRWLVLREEAGKPVSVCSCSKRRRGKVVVVRKGEEEVSKDRGEGGAARGRRRASRGMPRAVRGSPPPLLFTRGKSANTTTTIIIITRSRSLHPAAEAGLRAANLRSSRSRRPSRVPTRPALPRSVSPPRETNIIIAREGVRPRRPVRGIRLDLRLASAASSIRPP